MLEDTMTEQTWNDEGELVVTDTVITAYDEGAVQVQDLIALTARLAQILAQEADYLEAMQVSKLEPLQTEKIALTNALESVKRQLAKQPHLLEQMSDEDRDDLQQVVTVFHAVLEENYRRLTMARAVNQKIVEAISEVIHDTVKNDAYDRKGITGKPTLDSVSITLDKQV